MKLQRNTLLFTILIISMSFFAFTTLVENKRTIEGRVIDEITKKPIATDIIISRQGQDWYVKSTPEGWYSITLDADKAYAVKIYNGSYKSYINAIFLAEEMNNQSFNYNIELMPDR